MRHRTCMEGFFGQFLRQSTLHGVKYIGSPDKHPCEKLFWIVAVLISLGFSCYMVEELYRKYNDNPIIISFQPKETTIAQIPFPALTLCNVNILKTQLMLDVIRFLTKEERKYVDANYTDVGKYMDALLLSEHMTHYCLAAPSFRRLLNETLLDALGTNDYVQTIQDYMSREEYAEYMKEAATTSSDELKYNISTFKHGASHHCEDMILKCMWAMELIPCDKLFNRIYTQHGGCCVFNMMPTYILRNIPENDTRAKLEVDIIPEEERKEWQKFTADSIFQKNVDSMANLTYPKHPKAGGKSSGLSILINPELDMYSTCNSNDAIGFKMVAHSPISFPNIMDYGVAIPPSSEVFIDIEPQLTTADESDLKSIDINKRSCYFPTDPEAKLTSYRFYSSANCMDECIARLTYENCSCVRYFMPYNSTQSLCGAKKLGCSEEVRKNVTATGKSGYCNECKPACTEIQYKMQLSHFPLRENISSITYSTSDETDKLAKNYSIVHIFLGWDSLYAKERKRLYDASDLLANAGGILSLTLGFSIISLVEVFYFLTLRAWFQGREDRAADEDEGEDFYSRSTGGYTKRKLSVVSKPRIMDGLQSQNKINSYYNWAMTATSAVSNIIDVKSSHQTTVADNEVSQFNGVPSRRRIPAFELLSRETTGKSKHPYLS